MIDDKYRPWVKESYFGDVDVLTLPVRHGKWIRDEFGTRCGACGLYAQRDKFGKPWESQYCPNCGAKMDGESKEE